jgi:hypothetical protein
LAWHFGSDEIPGGPLTFTAAQDAFLRFAKGPSSDVTLSWSTFSKAADEAGRSRIWGGIHPWFDDQAGRKVGADVARAVTARLGTQSGRAGCE